MSSSTFATKPSIGGFTATDSTGFVIRVLQVPTEDVFTSFGHVALRFHLRETHVGREEVKIDDNSRAVYDGRDFFLILQTELFDAMRNE
jgi:hypothetical protein